MAVTSQPLDLEALMQHVVGSVTGDGAVATFTGLVRDHNQGRTVRFLEYEAYEPLALRALARIVDEVAAAWPGVRLGIHHRTGRLEIGEASVIIAVSSAHRDAAFQAAAYAIERIKQIVPIWKKEAYDDGETWIGSEADYQVEIGRMSSGSS